MALSEQLPCHAAMLLLASVCQVLSKQFAVNSAYNGQLLSFLKQWSVVTSFGKPSVSDTAEPQGYVLRLLSGFEYVNHCGSSLFRHSVTHLLLSSFSFLFVDVLYVLPIRFFLAEATRSGLQPCLTFHMTNHDVGVVY